MSSRSNRKAGPMTAVSRLRMDYMRLKKDPVPYIVAEPLPSNMLEWHYCVSGPEQSPYFGGIYHGKLVFPAEFPFKPPSIYIITPNGRFKCNTRLCLSISDYHPDTWNPAWSVSTILTGLLSFMLEKSPTLGSIETSDYDKRQFATKSHEFNLKNKTFCELFPDLAEKSRRITELHKIQNTKKLNGSNGLNGSGSGNGENQTEESIREKLERNRVMGGAHGFQGAVTNFLVIGGFAAFAFVVQYVIQTIASTSDN